MKEILGWIKDIAIAVIIAALILTFFKPIIVRQQSMVPTFNPNDYVIISRQAYNIFGDVERGDVIVFKTNIYDENGKEKNYIKRVIALAGDEICIKNENVYVNGEEVNEPYINEIGYNGAMDLMTVPEGQIFVMGDNRRVSEDSRSPNLGTVDIDSILGKVVLRLYPFNDIKVF